MDHIQGTMRGGLIYKDGKNRKYEATVENRVIYCANQNSGNVEIAVLLDGCTVLADEDCGFTIMAAKAAKERKGKVRRSVLGKKSSQGSMIGHHFVAFSSAERDQWVEAINVACKIYKQSAGSVSGQLTVEVVEGKNLAPKDFHLLSANTSDPYVVLRINNQQNKTRTIYKTLNPTWNEEFSFEISRNEAILFVSLYDEDLITRSDSMGQVVFPLSSLSPSETRDVWLPVLPKKPYEKISGQIRLKLTYEFTKEEETKPMGPIFGMNLMEICNNAVLCADGIPKFFSEILAYLEKHAINEPGIFRVSGSLVQCKALKQSIDEGKAVDYSECLDIHCVSGVLKMYLRELPIPVLTYENYTKLVALTTLGEKEKMHELKMLLTVVPQAHVDLLKVLLPSLKRFSQNSQINMMTTSNLAIVFGPSLCRPQIDNFETVLHAVNITSLTSTLIDHNISLFN